MSIWEFLLNVVIARALIISVALFWVIGCVVGDLIGQKDWTWRRTGNLAFWALMCNWLLLLRTRIALLDAINFNTRLFLLSV